MSRLRTLFAAAVLTLPFLGAVPSQAATPPKGDISEGVHLAAYDISITLGGAGFRSTPATGSA